jgi:uncharacterized repeat protein (TIGR01451 family)
VELMSKRALVCVLSLFLVLGPALAPALASAPAGATPQQLTSIYEIQYTTDPGAGGTYPSPRVGQTVTTRGVVYARYGGGFCIADAAGPWHGVYVYYPSGTKPDMGDLVEVQGTVQEYYGLTELADYASYVVISESNPLFAPALVTTTAVPFGDPDLSEPYESVLVEYHDIEVTQPADTHGVWAFTDASAGTSKADDWGYHLEPAVGDRYAILRGALIYTFDEYRVMPRDAGDLIAGRQLLVSKEAPLNVTPGDLLTYTISVENNTTLSLTRVMVTDTIPITNAALAYILDGGALSGTATISWTAPGLPAGEQLQVRFVVTATGEVGDMIVNRAYAAWASNWPTPTVGGPLFTAIGDYTPIPLIQGDGFLSPLEGQPVRTQGIVTGFFEGNYSDGGGFDGFFIQDPTGDGITTTADALYVNHENLAVAVDVGDWVTVTGVVQEFDEYDRAACIGESCWTQIAVAAPTDVEVFGSGVITPAVFAPRGNPVEGRAYYESLEGMLLTLPQTGTVVGPTNYGTVMVVPGTLGISHVLRLGPYAGMPVGLRHYERYGEIGGGDPPNLIVGSVITGVTGPLAFSYGNYLVTTQAGAPWSAVYAQPEPSPVPTWPPADPTSFTVLSFNVENFFDTVDDPGKDDPIVSPADYALKRDKIARTIAQAGCPVIVGLQEVEKLAVLEDVADELAAAYGCTYTATLLEGLDERGIDVGYLTRDDRVAVVGVWQYQDCTTYDTGLGQGDCPAGQQRLFSRIPLVLTATIQMGAQPTDTITATLIVNHLKSKLSSSGDPESATWRLLQAQSLATLTNGILTADPDTLLVVMGDLNDFEDAPPLEVLYATGQLTSTWYTLPPEARYSYIYNGVSQILDHILVSPAAREWVTATGVLHYNADMPYKPYAEDPDVVWGTSDHDPPVVTLALPPCRPVTETDFVWTPLTPTVGAPITFTASAAGDPPFSYSWDWGDGSSSDMGPTKIHTYTVAGTYTVTLTVTNTCGLDTHSEVILVREAQYFVYLPLVGKGDGGR